MRPVEEALTIPSKPEAVVVQSENGAVGVQPGLR